jgi:hypothetical protein
LEQRIKRKIIIGFARSAIKSLQVGRSLVIVIVTGLFKSCGITKEEF